MNDIFKDYQKRLCDCLLSFDWTPVSRLAKDMKLAMQKGKHIFLCGNGGSAANAIHMANDFLCSFARINGKGIKVTALSSNQAVLTCLGNDIGYENIFSFQLETLAEEGDILVVLSGSGNSPNVLKAVKTAKRKRIKTYAIVGYDGGKCLELVDVPIHFAIDDMQILEDLQLVVGHMLLQGLSKANLEKND